MSIVKIIREHKAACRLFDREIEDLIYEWSYHPDEIMLDEFHDNYLWFSIGDIMFELTLFADTDYLVLYCFSKNDELRYPIFLLMELNDFCL